MTDLSCFSSVAFTRIRGTKEKRIELRGFLSKSDPQDASTFFEKARRLTICRGATRATSLPTSL